jgi:Spy/CpxP family protein refolding chaperone
MKTSKWLVLTVAAVLAAGGVFVFHAQAAENAAPQRPLRGHFLQRAKEKLGLSDEQVAQIKTQLASEKDTLKNLISKWHDARVNLRSTIQAPDATEASVRAASAKVAAVEADLAVERLKLFGKLSPILTADQREKVKEFQSRVDDVIDNAISRIGERLTAQ